MPFPAKECLEVYALLQIPFYIAKGVISWQINRHEKEYSAYGRTPQEQKDPELVSKFSNCLLFPTPFDFAAIHACYRAHNVYSDTAG